MKSLNALQPLGLLALRLAFGLIFFSHGYPKLAHAGGGMQEFFVQHGLPGYFVYIAGVLEVFGAILLALGLFTRGAALLLAIERIPARVVDGVFCFVHGRGRFSLARRPPVRGQDAGLEKLKARQLNPSWKKGRVPAPDYPTGLRWHKGASGLDATNRNGLLLNFPLLDLR